MKDKLCTFQFGNDNISSKLINIGNIRSFCCGENHSIILTKDGLYGFGKNNYGQLGVDNYLDYNYPHKINFDKKIIAISCGTFFTLVVTEDRKLYGCGDNEFGQLGLTNYPYLRNEEPPYSKNIVNYYDNNFLKYVLDDKNYYDHNLKYNYHNKLTYCGIDNVLAIDCGSTHSMILTKTGLYSCGTNTKGELGIGKYSTYECIPQKVLLNNVISMHSGCEFTLIRTKTKLYRFGRGICKYIDSNTKYCTPKIVNIKNIMSIKCRENYAMIQTEDGLYELKDKKNNYNLDINEINIQDVISFDCGINDSLIITKDGLYNLKNNQIIKITNF
jgi:alpha-tubulin suppressor-like RCC1 family protein